MLEDILQYDLVLKEVEQKFSLCSSVAQPALLEKVKEAREDDEKIETIVLGLLIDRMFKVGQ